MYQKKGEPGYYTEKYRPQYHFTPETGWMNDPNGLIYFKEQYHIFYQYNPKDIIWGPMHWGHAVSPDMVTWEHLPVALYPDGLGDIFSGSAVNQGNEMYLFFTHASRESQRQSVAISTDNGQSFEKYSGNPIVSDPEYKDFRDPKVIWYEKGQKWVMLIAAYDKIMFYESTNLYNWNKLSQFGPDQGNSDGVWECPDLFETEDRISGKKYWVLMMSVSENCVNGGPGVQYFVGDFDGTEFINVNKPDVVLLADHGMDFYAAQTFFIQNTSDQRAISMAWVSNWRYGSKTPTDPWRGMLTIPRELSAFDVNGQIRLCQQPVKELTKLKKDLVFEYFGKIPRQGLTIFDKLEEGSFCINFQIEYKDEPESCSFELLLFHSKESPGRSLIIGYDSDKNILYTDRTGVLPEELQDFNKKTTASCIRTEGKINFTIFADRSSVEIFACNGLVSMTNLVFPQKVGGGAVIYPVRENEINISFMKVHKLDRVW